MGSHTWVRSDKAPTGGKSFAVGVAAVVPPPSKKRKLVWQRHAKDGPGSSGEKAPDAPAQKCAGEAEDGTRPEGRTVAPAAAADGAGAHVQQQRRAEVPHTAAPKQARKAAPSSNQQQLEALRRDIEQRQAAAQQAATAAGAAHADAVARQRREEEERGARRSKLEAGFATAFAAAKEAAAAQIKSARVPIAFADEVEVRRVLSAASDYAVLRLAPGADAAAVRRRYREMAVTLHPDKCGTPDASDAFHRVVQAYQQLSKYAK